MEPLINILKRASGQLEEGWLYLPENEDWNCNTLGQVIDVDELDDDQVDEDCEPLIAREKGLISTLDSGTIESIAEFAKDLEYEFTDELLLESFLYYYDYDAFYLIRVLSLFPQRNIRIKWIEIFMTASV